MVGKHGLPSGILGARMSPDRKKQRDLTHNITGDGPASPRRRQRVHSKPFTKANAKALYHQMQGFEDQYRKEGCKAPKNASPKHIDLCIARGTLHLRHREIRDTLYHAFYADASRTLRPASRIYRHLVDYRAALTRHQALWYHRKALRRTLSSTRALKQKILELAVAEAADDADTERDLRDKHDPSCERVGFAKRKKWYQTVKKDMRKRGQWISKEAPGPGVEWEPANVHESPGVRVKFFNPVAGGWILPRHIKKEDDFGVYLNQMGLRFSPVSRHPEDQPWA
ncbi:uncharacterized protein ColSpa_07082 [Colletotrichum spaethianum]|uniref:Uncharacterized protein n=1 Tax=Colletotrichum spaethianum TaxID=700344 RepID=A0AA37LDZ7_9PEZI|nr:uncharacterized protein ColSpa_07082 [Colletotrichum spaethianum]GKT46901.1 hypothetical protein ColSpa_07082 [Colletotrichum spaethianum]